MMNASVSPLRPFQSALGILAALLALSSTALSQNGRIETITVHSQALETNLLGDSPDRSVSIYLPPQYDNNPEVRFPVIYMLHGYMNHDTGFLSALKAVFDTFFSQGSARPMIIVIPDGFNRYWGCWYTNSVVSGGWEDFISEELVSYIDQHYRTVAEVSGRGITGHSMGGYGALKLAMKHPAIFSAVYSMSGALLSFEHIVMGVYYSRLLDAVRANTFTEIAWQSKALVAAGIAFAPIPNDPPPANLYSAPFMCEFPVDWNGSRIDSCWERWLEHDILSLIPTHRDSLLQLHAIGLDCGELDDLLIGSQAVHDELDAQVIPHLFEAYAGGDHTNKIPERVGSYVLPFFAGILTSVGNGDRRAPHAIALAQNYPNPFNPTTTIEYSLPHSGYAALRIYNVLGEEIATLLTGDHAAGMFTVTWDASGVPSGVYFYRLTAGEFVQTKKAVLMK